MPSKFASLCSVTVTEISGVKTEPKAVAFHDWTMQWSFFNKINTAVTYEVGTAEAHVSHSGFHYSSTVTPPIYIAVPHSATHFVQLDVRVNV